MVLVMSLLVALIGVALLPTQPAKAAGTPFPRGQGLIFVSQGSPTRLYESVQSPGTNATTFKPVGDVQTITYNAMGFNPTDMYLYAINSTTNRLIQIDSTGATTGLGSGGSVTNLPALAGSNTYNGGTIGSCTPLNTLWVTPSTAAGTNTIYSINVANTVPNAVAVALHLSAGIGGHSTLPNVADIVCMNDGANNYLWAVYGGNASGTDPDGMYRINIATGVLDYFSLSGVITADWGASFGAQWLYGNGHLGISNNQTGNIHQIQIDNPSSATPTFTEVAVLTGPASTTNDGASYAGEPVDLALSKTVTTDHGTFDSTDSPFGEYIPGSNITYTLTVENIDPLVTSSGFFVTDTLDAQFTDPSSISFDTDSCYISSDTAPLVQIPITIVCTSGVLNPGETQSFNINLTTPTTLNTSLSNVATVTGNEDDPDFSSNDADVTIDAATSGYVISKSAALVGPGHHVVPGATVEYTVTITNTGETDYCLPLGPSCPAGQAEFVDDLSDVADDAIYNDDAVIAGISIVNDTVAFNDSVVGSETLDWIGDLAVGETKTVTYSFTITTPGVGSNRILNNSVTATHDEGGCSGVCSTQTLVGDPGYSITKSVDKATITPNGTLPNDWVNYTIAVTNTGTSPYTSHHPASVEDDLSNVFDDAVFGNVISSTTGTATISGSVLSWSGPLAVGATTYITYQVRVNVPSAALVAGGNLAMINSVAPLNGEGICINCSTETTVVALATPPPPPLTPPITPGAPNTGLLGRGLHYWYLLIAAIAGIGVMARLLVRRKNN